MSMSSTELSPLLLKRIAEEAISARAVQHAQLNNGAKAELKRRATELLKSRKAVLVAHYYVDSELQELAEETQGCVADSLEMARFGFAHPAGTIVVAGVRFMGETAKILSPESASWWSIQPQNALWILVARQRRFRHFVTNIPTARWWFMPTPAQR